MIFENTGKKSWNELDDNTKGLLMLAYYEGKTIQEWWDNENEWEDWHDFDYNSDDCYPPKWQHGIWRIKPEPVKQVHWCNDYKDFRNAGWHKSRENADSKSGAARIAVIRREIVDGVVSSLQRGCVMTDAELIAMARLAQRDDRMSTGALYGDLADRIEELDRACSEWADVSQANYQRAKKAEAKLAKAMEAERKLHEAHIKAQAAEIERLREALQWCSGSADFNEGGIAREGWLKLCAPLLTGGATVKDYLTTEDEKQSHEWKCPIDYPGCRKNCGSYGCGN